MTCSTRTCDPGTPSHGSLKESSSSCQLKPVPYNRVNLPRSVNEKLPVSVIARRCRKRERKMGGLDNRENCHSAKIVCFCQTAFTPELSLRKGAAFSNRENCHHVKMCSLRLDHNQALQHCVFSSVAFFSMLPLPVFRCCASLCFSSWKV